MRFLITGGAGFIGSHLAEALLGRGHRVHILDDLSTGSIDNIRHLKTDPRFSYTIDTCVSASVVAELVDDADDGMVLPTFVGQALGGATADGVRRRTADALLLPRRRRGHRFG